MKLASVYVIGDFKSGEIVTLPRGQKVYASKDIAKDHNESGEAISMVKVDKNLMISQEINRIWYLAEDYETTAMAAVPAKAKMIEDRLEQLWADAKARAAGAAAKFGPHPSVEFSACRLAEEAGELIQATTSTSHPKDRDGCYEEAVDTVAMVIRLVEQWIYGGLYIFGELVPEKDRKQFLIFPGAYVYIDKNEAIRNCNGLSVYRVRIDQSKLKPIDDQRFELNDMTCVDLELV